ALSVLRCGSNVEPTTATDIALVAGDGQAGTVGTALASPLVVAVTDANNNAVPGVSVIWQAQGGGNVSSETVKTGSNGQASVTRTLGPTPGPQTTTATVSGLQGSPITFMATAVEGNPNGGIVITTNPPVAALTSEVFDPAVQPVVVVTVPGGNPAPGEQVTASIASGSGQLEGKTTATTDANGIARFTDLGINGTGDNTIEFTAGTATVSSSPITLSPLPTEAIKGKWGSIIPWDIVPLHISLMPNGKIIAWGKFEAGGTTMAMPRIWDPSTGSPSGAPMIQLDTMLFCAGHTLMPDGRLMVSGGHKADDTGINRTNFFTQDGVWQPAANMAHGRWYPTVTVLPDGRALTMAGRDENGQVVEIPEIWQNDHWVELPGANGLEIPYYPRNFVDPKNGLIFYAGERIVSRWFDPSGLGSWISGPTHIWRFNRDYGTAVMYETGKILYAGGGGHTGWPTPDAKSTTPTATAEKIDLIQPSPTWETAGSMSAPRRHLNSTVLPDGQVLITGGTRGGGFVDINEADAVKTAELWNPKIGPAGQWTTLASASKMRVYHSVSLLLPDGTVLHGASGDAMAGLVPVPPERNHEIFSPPYLFKSLNGSRPVITSAPASVGYGQTFSVQTPYAAQITDVRWIRLGSVTHAFDAGQRANTLIFSQTATGVDVTAPPDSKSAPPGYYQLFILNRNGVPSVGKVVKIP
ncbi:MAG TPA: galactose oxidase-like domain-containing protein, partial [Gemmatimonadales bacterium]|nr:galactose oxidase-like domain-containing protein [Gemmatimonadales bacterium]